MLDEPTQTVTRADLLRVLATYFVSGDQSKWQDRGSVIEAVAAHLGIREGALDAVSRSAAAAIEAAEGTRRVLAMQMVAPSGYDGRIGAPALAAERRAEISRVLDGLGDALLPTRAGGIEKMKIADIVIEALG